jgi:hypothetical protein
MAGGCVVALCAGGALLMGVVVAPLSGHPSPFVYSNYEMNRDGVIYKVTTRDFEPVEAVDLNGQPLADAKTGGKTIRAQLSEHQAYGASAVTPTGDWNQARNVVEEDRHILFRHPTCCGQNDLVFGPAREVARV